jgi:hypothetical protein
MMSSDREWRESYGELRLPFFSAAGQIVDGNFQVDCPNCHQAALRFYYHVFNKAKDTGTLWAWCPNCRMTTHLPRVQPEGWCFPDPFAALSLDEFAEFDASSGGPLVERLDKLWAQGKIGLPKPLEAEGRKQQRTKPPRR